MGTTTTFMVLLIGLGALCSLTLLCGLVYLIRHERRRR